MQRRDVDRLELSVRRAGLAAANRVRQILDLARDRILIYETLLDRCLCFRNTSQDLIYERALLLSVD